MFMGQEQLSATPAKPLPRWMVIAVYAACALAALYLAVTVVLLAVYYLRPNAFVYDAQMYWAIGRGILNGLVPYRDLYENKPPGIFLLSTASLALLKSYWLGNLWGALSILSTPLALGWCAWKRTFEMARSQRLLWLAFSFFVGGFWAVVVANNGSPWQTETMGWPFALLFVLVTFFQPSKRWVHLCLAALGLLGSIGFKEPFVIGCLAASVLASRHPRDLLRLFVYPLILAVAVGTCVAAALGWLMPYLTIHLPAVFGYRGYGFAPLWMRSFGFYKIGQTLFARSAPSIVAIAASCVAVCVAAAKRPPAFANKTAQRTWVVAQLLLTAYLGMLAVGAPGDYQNHHYVFFGCFYVALWCVLLRDGRPYTTRNERWMAGTVLALWTLTAACTLQPERQLVPLQEIASTKIAAAGIDEVLDRCGVDRYLMIKKKAYALSPWAYTRHSPLNHALFWQIDSGLQYGQAFLDISLQRLSQTQVIVFPPEVFQPNNAIGVAMAQYISTHFSTDNPPNCALPAPDLQGYGIAFRTDPEPFTEHFEINLSDPVEVDDR